MANGPQRCERCNVIIPLEHRFCERCKTDFLHNASLEVSYNARLEPLVAAELSADMLTPEPTEPRCHTDSSSDSGTGSSCD